MSNPGLLGHLTGIDGPSVKMGVKVNNRNGSVDFVKRTQNRKDNRMVTA